MNNEIEAFDDIHLSSCLTVKTLDSVIEYINGCKEASSSFGDFMRQLLSVELLPASALSNDKVGYIIHIYYIPYILDKVTPSKIYKDMLKKVNNLYKYEIEEFKDSKEKHLRDLYYLYKLCKGDKYKMIDSIVETSNNIYIPYDWKQKIVKK